MTEVPGYAAGITPGPLGKVRGYTTLLPLAAPAAGAPVVFKVPPDRWARLVLLYTGLVTSAVVAARFPRLELHDENNQVFGAFTSIYSIPASDTVDLTWAAGWFSQTSAASADMAFALPSVLLKPTWSINITALAIDVGDQFTTPKALVELYPTGPYGPPMGVVPLDEAPWAALG